MVVLDGRESNMCVCVCVCVCVLNLMAQIQVGPHRGVRAPGSSAASKDDKRRGVQDESIETIMNTNPHHFVFTAIAATRGRTSTSGQSELEQCKREQLTEHPTCKH